MTAAFVRDIDQLPVLDPGPAIGSWRNTNWSTWGIARAAVTERDGRLVIRLWGTDPAAGREYDWGEVPIDRLYADGPSGRVVGGYTATFDLGHARVGIEANTAYGLTVLAAFTSFTDGSGRQDYFSREFFHRLDGTP